MSHQEQRLELAVQKLKELEAFEHNPVYAWLVLPILKELDGLKSAYDCKTLTEIKTLQGKYSGLRFPIAIMEQVRREGELAQQWMRDEEQKNIRIEKELLNPDLLDLPHDE